MHIFFWFFKQLYYLLKHFKLKNFLLLLAFFVIAFFLFIKPSFASTPTTLNSFTYNGTTYYFDYPLTLTNENNCYYILSNEDMSTIYVVEPVNTTYNLVILSNLHTGNYTTTNGFLIIRGFYNNSLQNIKLYQCTYDNNSFSQWTDTTETQLICDTSTTHYNFIEGNNIQLYTRFGQNYSNTLLFNDTDLPSNIDFTDNIAFVQRPNNTGYLLYTSSNNSRFSFTSNARYFTCIDTNNNNVAFDLYSYDVTNNSWTKIESNITTYDSSSTGLNFYYFTYPVYYNNNLRTGLKGFTDFFAYLYRETLPYIENSNNSIKEWTFDNLVINGGTSVGLADNYYLRYTYPDNNTSYQFNINQYFDLSNGTIFFNIPRTRINEDIVIRPNTNIYFTLICKRNVEGGTTTEVYDLSGYTLTLTQENANTINEDSDKQIISDLKQEQQQTTQAIESLENTITDTNIDNSSITLPTDTTTDITRDGLNNIFTMLYNAFCTGTPQDIVLPIPYTNKSITINPNYLHDMLYNYTGTWLINIIEAFYWYIISRFIIKDIVNKINKIKSGDLEKIETSNIKGDML